MFKILQDLHTAHPDNREVTMHFATELAAFKHYDRALELLLPLSQDEGFAGCLQSTLEIGHLYNEQNLNDQARSYYLHGRRLSQVNPWPALCLSKLAEKTGQMDVAVAELRQGFDSLDAHGKAVVAQRMTEIEIRTKFPAMRASPDWGVRPVALVPGLERCCLMILVKDEADIIGQNLQHHYDLGFRIFCLIDNFSHDGTPAIITSFRARHPDALVFSAVDPIAGHYQAEKMKTFTDMMPSYCDIAGRKLDWIFYVDADEFLAPCLGADSAAAFAGVLADPAIQMLVFHWVHCGRPDQLVDLTGTSPMAAFPLMQTDMSAPASKIAVRFGSHMYPTQGNHFVDDLHGAMASIAMAADIGWFMLHFPLRSFNQVKSKVINGGKAFAGAKGLENHGGHWKERYELYLRHGDNLISQLLTQYNDGFGASR